MSNAGRFAEIFRPVFHFILLVEAERQPNARWQAIIATADVILYIRISMERNEGQSLIVRSILLGAVCPACCSHN